jgi:hypothetical protein
MPDPITELLVVKAPQLPTAVWRAGAVPHQLADPAGGPRPYTHRGHLIPPSGLAVGGTWMWNMRGGAYGASHCPAPFA